MLGSEVSLWQHGIAFVYLIGHHGVWRSNSPFMKKYVQNDGGLLIDDEPLHLNRNGHMKLNAF